MSSDDLWWETVYGPANIAAASPFSQWELAKKSEFSAVKPLETIADSPMKQRRQVAPRSSVEFSAAMKSRALTSTPIFAPVEHRSVFEQRCALYRNAVADVRFADELRSDDAAVSADASHGCRFRFGILGGDGFQTLRQLRAMTVHGSHIGVLRAHTVENHDAAPAVFIDGLHLRAVAECRTVAAFERGYVADDGAVADFVILDCRILDDRARTRLRRRRGTGIRLSCRARNRLLRRPSASRRRGCRVRRALWSPVRTGF